MTEHLTKREKKQRIKDQITMLKEMMGEYKSLAADVEDIVLFKKIKLIESEMEEIITHFEDQMIF